MVLQLIPYSKDLNWNERIVGSDINKCKNSRDESPTACRMKVSLSTTMGCIIKKPV
jgi:hypothetical protein